MLLKPKTSTGEIDFGVQDTMAAVIPKAVITVTGSDTGNLLCAISTNEAGLAEAPFLPPGSYDIALTEDEIVCTSCDGLFPSPAALAAT